MQGFCGKKEPGEVLITFWRGQVVRYSYGHDMEKLIWHIDIDL